MSQKDNGGQAIANLTVRDFFIAHAPADPQPWFKPKMPPVPPAKWVDESGNQYNSAREAESAVGEDGYWDENRGARDEWEKEKAKQRFIQWPAAWADIQLKARTT